MSFLNGVVSIRHCKFINNSANTNGGAVYTKRSDVIVGDCMFINNSVSGFGSGGMFVEGSNVSIDHSTFISNSANIVGGAVYAKNSVLKIVDCTFVNNSVRGYGSAGGIYVTDSIVSIASCSFVDNTASNFGGALYVKAWSTRFTATVIVVNCTFINNKATATETGSGGAVNVYSAFKMDVYKCIFINNTASIGGAVSVSDVTNITMDSNSFIFNVAVGKSGSGGALYVELYDSITRTSNFAIRKSKFIDNCAGDGESGTGGGTTMYGLSVNLTDVTLTHNSAAKGAAIFLHNCRFDLSSDGYLNIDSNVASYGVVYAAQSTVSLSGVTTVSNNTGSVFAFNSSVTLSGNTTFTNNSYPKISQIQEGGAITSFQSNLNFHDTVSLQCNEARSGGAILATESKVYMYGNITITDNRALQSGGGIYGFQTEFNMEHGVIISRNKAKKKGGGMYAISSNVKVLRNALHFIGNHANRGGGVCLELNAKLYIIKMNCEDYGSYTDCNQNANTWPMIVFTNNSADYGGAVYVTDDTNSGTCSATPSTEQSATSECFFQVLALFTRRDIYVSKISLTNLNFTSNTAKVAGRTLFGGLLDRCTLSPFAEVQLLHSNPFNGTAYFLNVTNLAKSDLNFGDISSNPVRVCFCKDDQPDFSYRPTTKRVLKGGLFTVSVVAVDQVNNTVPNSTIHGSLLSGRGRLSEGQAIQQTNDSCTELRYNAFSPLGINEETLLLYAEGPCNDTGISASYINLTFQHCPVGFQQVQEGDCSCDPALSPYITVNCFIDNQTVLREGDYWITYLADLDVSDEFVTNSSNENADKFVIKHANCPFDYCHPPTKKVYINFSIPSGADAQCAFNRTGILCGSCGENLSLSLGSSHCMLCSHELLALLIPFALAGIALVAFLLVFNLTVVVGTINGLIFYANIIAANHATFLPFHRPNFLTIFIAWLNLDFGFETCFYDGMNGYVKVWLQLAFPCYIIFLVAMVIVMCEYSYRFSKLLSYTNPVATLATLILLSYAKLLRTIVAALSFTTLEYPDGVHARVWLYDANIPYLEGKHIPLFIAALFILFAGLVYTFLLIFWQLLIRCSNERQVQWLISNIPTLHTCYARLHTYLNAFMDVYHAPYNPRHRYWTGLLLLLRGVLYLISAVNVFGDPSINLLSISCVVILLFTWKLLVPNVYKSVYVNNLNTLFLINLAVFTAGASYLRAAGIGNRAALAYTSTSIAFIKFLAIICYHTKKHLCMLVRKKIRKQHRVNNHLSIKAEESGRVEQHKQLVPLSPAYSVTEFDGLPDPDPDQDSQQVG